MSLNIAHNFVDSHRYFAMFLQHKMFTTIHKHYSVDAWKEFAESNKEALKVNKKYQCLREEEGRRKYDI